MAAALTFIAIAANAEEEDHPNFRAGVLANFADYNGDPSFPI